MGRAKPFEKCILVMGVLSAMEDVSEAERRLEEMFGPIKERTVPVPFDFTDYYDSEMGRRPERHFIVFSNPVDPSSLAAIKLKTNELEKRFSTNGQRRINLDPGVLSLGSLILATTKPSAHRIPLADGIWGETTLLYHHGSYNPLDWTYADYRSSDFIVFFNNLRKLLKSPAGR